MKVPNVLQWLFGYDIEINKYGITFLTVTIVEILAVMALTIGNIVLNALTELPSYTSYYLNAVSILVLIIMLYFATDAVYVQNHHI